MSNNRPLSVKVYFTLNNNVVEIKRFPLSNFETLKRLIENFMQNDIEFLNYKCQSLNYFDEQDKCWFKLDDTILFFYSTRGYVKDPCMKIRAFLEKKLTDPKSTTKSNSNSNPKSAPKSNSNSNPKSAPKPSIDLRNTIVVLDTNAPAFTTEKMFKELLNKVEYLFIPAVVHSEWDHWKDHGDKKKQTIARIVFNHLEVGIRKGKLVLESQDELKMAVKEVHKKYGIYWKNDDKILISSLLHKKKLQGKNMIAITHDISLRTRFLTEKIDCFPTIPELLGYPAPTHSSI
jgi:rRNA-processing protein FCF1